MNNYLTLTPTFALLMLSCSISKEDRLLLNAARTHNEALEVAVKIEKRLEEMAADTTRSIDSVKAWRAAIEMWESELIEVPGNETHHHHSHHGQQSDLTSEQMLGIQMESKRQIELLAIRINSQDLRTK